MFTRIVKPAYQSQQMQGSLSINDGQCETRKQKFCEFRGIFQNMQKFIKDVENIKVDPEDNVIYKYCGTQPYLILSSTTVLQLLQKRIQKMIKNKKIKRNWSEEDLKILFWVINHYTLTKNIRTIQQMAYNDWNYISNLIPGTSGDSCMFRILSLKKTKLSQQQWEEDQSNLLYEIVETKDQVDWKIISEQLFLMNNSPTRIFRNAKQCKQHWNCFLNPRLKKGPWQANQDILLLERILQNNGKKRWTQLIKYFDGRTENALKNRFCLIIQRTKLQCNEKEEIALIETALRKLKLLNKQKKYLKFLNPLLKYDSSSSSSQINSQTNSKTKELKYPKQNQSTQSHKGTLKQGPFGMYGSFYFSQLIPNNQFILLYNQPNLNQ